MDEVSPFEPTVVSAVARHWRLVVVVVVVSLALGGAFAFTRPAKYTATASLTVGDPRGQGVLGGQNPEAPDRYVADQLVVFDSIALGTAAVQRGLDQNPRLRESASWYIGHTSASATAQDNNLLSVSFSAPDGARAMAGLRAVVDAYGDVTQAAVAAQALGIRRQLDSSLGSLAAQVRRLQPTATNPAVATQIQQLTVSQAALASRREQVAGEFAHPSSGVSQSLLPSEATTAGKVAALRILVLALAFGLLVGIALAYFRSYRRRVFVHQRDPELVLGAPLLIDTSSLRAIDLLGLAPSTDGPQAEQVAQRMFAIAASLLADQQLADGGGGMALAVVGAQNSASCSAVTWRLGLALALQGVRVLLIDIESAWPPAAAWTTRVTERLPWEETSTGQIVLGSPNGRSGPFGGRRPVGEIGADTDAARSGLFLCNEAPPVSSQKALRTVFRDLEADFDVILVVAPPFLPSADAAHLASAAGAAVVVVPEGSSVNDYEELARRLGLTATTPIGYVYCCDDCDVPSPQSGTGDRLKRALHVENSSAQLRKVSGLKGTT